MKHLISPPKFSIPDKYMQSRIELVVYNYELRKSIYSFRNNWDKKLGSYKKLLNTPAFWSQADVEIQNMLEIFKPKLPSIWEGIIFNYSVADKIWPVANIGFKDGLEPEHYLEKLASVASDAEMLFTSFDVNISLSNNNIDVTFYDNPTEKEWLNLKRLLAGQFKNKAKVMRSNSNMIPLYSKIADAVREKKSYKTIQHDLNDRYQDYEIKTMYHRAVKMGL